MTGKKLLMVDCDGTIREAKSGRKFVLSPQGQRIIKGAAQAISHFVQADYTIVGITNQGWVEIGNKTLEDCIAEQAYTLKLFPDLVSIYFCPDFSGRRCYRVSLTGNSYQVDNFYNSGKYDSFRKPGAGMLQLAMESVGEVETCFYVGDRPEDEEAAINAGIAFFEASYWRESYQDISWEGRRGNRQ